MPIAMTMASAVSDRSRTVWRAQLESGFRTVLACTIVGLSTLYGPSPIRTEIPFPAFSYVTAILIVSHATLGDTLRGCCHALLAMLQVVPLSILSLWVIGPCRLHPAFAAMAVAAGSFLVALPKSTKLLTKRIGCAQLVIVCIGAVLHGDRAGYFYVHPLHIASSTSLGATASILAMLVPYPRAAVFEVRKLFQLYNENACERVTLLMRAFLAQDQETAIDLISQSKPFAQTGSKLLQSIKELQDAVQWERSLLRKSKHHQFTNLGDRLQEMETQIRGLEIALLSCTSFPIMLIDEEIQNVMLQLQVQLRLKLGQATCFMQSDSMTAPESKAELVNSYESLNRLSNVSLTQNDLPSFFFLSCLQQLLTDSTIVSNHDTQESYFSPKTFSDILKFTPTNDSLVFAIKTAASLGLAVLFGLIFNKENGYWSGLTIAISIVTGRQATVTYSNARAQGTAIGTVYGVVGYFVFPGLLEFRFMLLVPWIIFTSCLRYSRMYGQAGYVSAIIAALLILGRKKYGQPEQFAITRLTEAVIGLFFLVVIEFIVQPIRAATIAKTQLSTSLAKAKECIEQVVLCSQQKEKTELILAELREKQINLIFSVGELKRFIADAEMEPDFWFLPFQGASYKKVYSSLSNMVDLLHFTAFTVELCVNKFSIFGGTEIQEGINEDLELLTEVVCSSLNFIEKITSIKSLAVFVQEGKLFHDLESGKSLDKGVGASDDMASKILNSFIQHSNEARNKIQSAGGGDALKVQMILCFCSLGFCISGLMKEAKTIENSVKELIRQENPSTRIDFFQISSKIDDVCIVNRTSNLASDSKEIQQM